jgi:Ca2+-binding EF-hand superfamily protein
MRTTTTILLLGTLGIACQGASDPKPKLEDEVTRVAPTTVEATAGAQSASRAESPEEAGEKQTAKAVPASVRAERIGWIRTAPELENVVSRTMAVVDSNSDGNITREEANGALNFVIGGFFFRADVNADGKITPKERKEARADLAMDHPEVSSLLTSLSTSAAIKTLTTSLDANIDQTIELKQARSTVREAVDAIFTALDENSDDVITAKEAAGGFAVAAAEAGRAVFRHADADNDGKMTIEEFQASLKPPLKRVFEAADTDNDGKLSGDEASSMMWWLSERVEAASVGGHELLANLSEASSPER